MATDPALTRASARAVECAETLARETTPRPRVLLLTLHPHLAIAAELHGAIWKLWSTHGVLPAAIRFAARHVTEWDTVGDSAPALLAAVVRATQRAHTAEISPAVQALRSDIKQLPRASASKVGKGLAELAVNVHAGTSALAACVPDSGSVADMALLVTSACRVIAALQTACGNEASLLDAAYKNSGIEHLAAAPYETFSTSAARLGSAHASLSAAHAIADVAANPKRVSP